MGNTRPSLDDIFSNTSPQRPSLDDIFQNKTPPADPGILSAALRGGAQGATLGFADELAGAGGAGIDALRKMSTSDLVKDYIANRDKYRQGDEAARASHPYAFGGGEVTGGLASALGTGGLGGGLKGALGLGAIGGLGASKADLTQGKLTGALKDTAAGAGLGGAAYGVLKGISNLAPTLSNTAENLAVKATGATGRQAEEFAPNAGRELLDRGIVKFGSTPEDISRNAAEAMSESQAGILDSLSQMDNQGVAVSRDALKEGLQQKISELSQDESQSGVIKQLQQALEDLEATPESRPISQVEMVKRGYQSQNNYLNPDVDRAGKIIGNVYREAVENAATKANPDIASQFLENKNTYGLLNPIQEAAEKRASQLSQSPIGGLLDVGSAVGGLASGHPIAAVTAPIARRALSPRLASSGAVLADKGADIVNSGAKLIQKLAENPATQKFSSLLQKAAARGAPSLASTHFILSQTEPEYQAAIQGLE